MKRLETDPRLAEEKLTMELMVLDYCRHHHKAVEKDEKGYCPDCRTFLDYSLKRLACCPYGGKKPVCAKCRIHCYKPAYRERTREIMRFAGPRLMFSHPILSVKHLWYSLTVKAPEKPRNRQKTIRTDNLKKRKDDNETR